MVLKIIFHEKPFVSRLTCWVDHFFVGSQFLVGSPTDHMLPAQLVNVAEAALGALPTTNDFFARLDAYAQNVPNVAQRPDEALFGNIFPTADKRPDGTHRTQQVIYAAVKDFPKVLCAEQVDIQDLDVWFRNFAKWTLVGNALLDDENLRSEAMVQRKQLCDKVGVTMRQWTPASLVTKKSVHDTVFQVRNCVVRRSF